MRKNIPGNRPFVTLNIVYIAPFILGGSKAPTFVNGVGLERESAINLHLDAVENPGDGGVIIYYSVKTGQPDQSTIEKE